MRFIIDDKICEKYNLTAQQVFILLALQCQNDKLYEDLIMVNKSSNAAGMTADYDLEVLQNTQKVNEYDLQINDINKKLQYTKLYFKTKADM